MRGHNKVCEVSVCYVVKCMRGHKKVCEVSVC